MSTASCACKPQPASSLCKPAEFARWQPLPLPWSKVMLLALDVGNTNTKLGIYRLDGGGLVATGG